MNQNTCALFQTLALISIIIITTVCANSLNNVFMKTISEEIGADLDILRREELGIDYVKKLYTSFKYTSAIIDANKTVNEIARKLEAKIDDIFAALQRAKKAIETLQLDHKLKLNSTLVPCISNGSLDLSSKNAKMCGNLLDMVLAKSSEDRNIAEKLQSKIWVMTNGVKQQYFISSSDVNKNFRSPALDSDDVDQYLLWNHYLLRNNYSPKNIVLVLDHGAPMSKNHLSILQTFAKKIISSLNSSDKIAILAISNKWSAPQLINDCLMPNQATSTSRVLPKLTLLNPNIRKTLEKFVSGITPENAATNHVLGLEKAFQVIESSNLDSESVMILYVSRGAPPPSAEATRIFEVIDAASSNSTNDFFINTCIISDGEAESGFLTDLAFRNYRKERRNGTMIAIDSLKNVGFAIGRFYKVFNARQSFKSEARVSLPTWDAKSGDLTLSFSVGCRFNTEFGVLGVDAYFNNWAEDILYLSNFKRQNYVFLMDLDGRAIVHPLFSSLNTVKQQLNFVDISHFESAPNFYNVKKRLLNEHHGVQPATQFGSTIKFTWRRVSNWYVVCFVSRESHRPAQRPHQIDWPFNVSDAYRIKLVYQHMENNQDSKLCRHLNQVATLDAGSLYLSSACFKSLSSLLDIKDPDSTQNYMTYLQDNTHTLKNPGLKDEIKDEVAVLAHILSFLRTQHLTSAKSKYIVRRFTASHGGALEMFPASIIDQGLDPTKRAWFMQAVEHKSKLVLVPPYLDEGGAGYIVTAAFATPHVVVGIDVTYGYVFRLVLKRMPFCLGINVTCFLMDDRGYLIYHPNLIDPNGHGPVEKQHIVHKESLVANDILGEKLFIKKVLCNSYAGGTSQRFYKLNTSFSDVLVNSVQGDHCVNYHIVAIPDTNVFIGIVNATCNVVVTFCPCSIVDRLCLNCNRMEQKECECPCECPLEQNQCTDFGSQAPLCTWFPEHVSLKARFRADADEALTECFPASCGAKKSLLRCLGVTGCEWCQYDVDGAALAHPFCASMATCFNGIVGSLTPYKNYLLHDAGARSLFNVPISFITLFVVGVVVLLVLFYFYHRSGRSQVRERLYLSSTQDNQLRMSDLNLSDNFHAVANHRDKLLQDEKPDPISPYCVSSTYRRTVLPAESDHGYSTMTQQDESEHLSVAPVEQDSGSDNVSVQTSGSSRGKGGVAQVTCLPRNNCIVVPVTVHRNREMT